MLRTFIVALFLGIAAHGIAQAKHSFAVRVTGEGPPVILIPGLTCGGDVWDATVEHLKGHYTCHVLTLPGFAGVAPIPAPILSTVKDEIEAYVTEKKLEHPVLVGHSLGGMMALWLASDKPEMFGGVISVDGVPYLGALNDPKQNPATLQPTVGSLRTYFKGITPQQLADSNAKTFPTMITDPANIPKVTASANKSDPASVGEAIIEMLQTDLRPDMSKLTAPMLLIVPDGNATGTTGLEALKARYEAQVIAVPQHQIVIAPKSKHFVMLDATAFFFDRLDEFLLRTVHRG